MNRREGGRLSGGTGQGLSPLWHRGQQPVNRLGLATVHGRPCGAAAAAWSQSTTGPGFQSRLCPWLPELWLGALTAPGGGPLSVK